MDGAVVPMARVLDGVDNGWVVDLVATLAAAELVGVAQWCVDTAATYAKDRVQFGRPIGQFQGVKHRCADMIARVELARAAVWDAARAVDDDPGKRALAAAERGRARHRCRVRQRQGLRPGARRHRLHLGARRPRVPPAGHDAAEPARPGVAVASGRRVGSGSTGCDAALTVDLRRRGRRPSAPRCGRSSPRSRTSTPTEQRVADRGRGLHRRRRGPSRGAGARRHVEQVVIEEEFRARQGRPPEHHRSAAGRCRP